MNDDINNITPNIEFSRISESSLPNDLIPNNNRGASTLYTNI